MLYSAKDVLDGWDTYEDGKMKDSKDLLYGELEKVTRKTGCPLLRFNDICKRDMKLATIDIESWELMVEDRSTWRHLVKRESSMQRIPETCDKWKREISEKQWAQRHYPIQFSNVKDVIKTVIQKSVF